MNTTLRYSAYIALLLGSTSIALADGGVQTNQVKGIFTIGGGFLNYEGGGEGADESSPVIVGNASALVHFSDAWSVQADLLAEQVVLGDDLDVNQYAQSQGVAVHVMRRFGSGQIGLFAGYGQGTAADDEFFDGGWYGIEGELWFDNVTVGGQAAVLDIGDHWGSGYGLVNDAYLLRGFGRYFFTNDVMAQIDLASVQGDDWWGDDTGSAEGMEWALSVQGRLADAPIYGGITYRNGDYEEYDGNSANIDELTFSLTVLFGSTNLRDNDRNGTSFDTSGAPLRTAAFLADVN